MRNKMLLVLVLVLIIGVMCVCFVACDKGANTDCTLVVGTGMSVESLNRLDAMGGAPGYNFDKISTAVSQMQFVQAVGEDMKPMLCEVSTTDNRNFEFVVKSGYTWHDGVVVSADDVKFTLEKETDGKAETISTIENKVNLALKEADPSFVNSLAGVNVLAKHIFDGQTKETLTDEKSVIGCGPFKYAGRDTDAGTITFEKYSAFPNAQNIKFDKIIFKHFANAEVMNLALINNEIDLIYNYSSGLTADSVSALSNRDSVKLISWSNTKRLPKVLYFNSQNERMTKDVRRALAKAIDYAKIRRLLSSGSSSPSKEGLVPDFVSVAIESPEWTRDLELSKQLLEKEGYTTSNKLNFELLVRTDNNDSQYADLIKTDLEETGLVNVVLIEKATSGEWLEYVQNAKHMALLGTVTAKGFDMGAGLASLYFLPRSSSANAMLTTPYGNNALEIGDERTEFGNIYYSLMGAQTDEQFLESARVYQEWIVENTPAVALYYDGITQAYSAKLEGDFVIDLTTGILNATTLTGGLYKKA